MQAVLENQAEELTFGVNLQFHVPVLLAPDDDPIEKPWDFPAEEWYKRNCLFYDSQDGRKIPVTSDDAKDTKAHRMNVWFDLLEEIQLAMEKPDWDRSKPDIAVVVDPSNYFPEDLKSEAERRKERARELGAFIGGSYENFDVWRVCKGENACWYSIDGARNSLWECVPGGPQRYAWFGVEVKSEVYKNLDDLERDLKKVCDRIRARFLVSVNFGMMFNKPSTHVHVGRTGSWDPEDENLPFDLTTAKKIATTMYLLEPTLMKLHAPWKLADYRYAARLRSFTHLGEFSTPLEELAQKDKPIDKMPVSQSKGYKRGAFRLDVDQRNDLIIHCNPSVRDGPHETAVKMIWGANNMAQLSWLLSRRDGTLPGALGLHGLVTTEKGAIKSPPLNTIAFRHMHGSLDAQDIMNWVHIINKIVRSATFGAASEYAALVASFDSSCGGDVEQLLKDLGLKLTIKPEDQIAKETSRPEEPRGTDDEQWRRMAPRMFLSGARRFQPRTLVITAG
ncbi:hypothetical protein M426DRAFT_6982 [Hypoxylon sp. CI-4A]|nr:hypothetical protein M426DRAFT_6982 [Hypoxylon sp. CI-4A]